jgi:hypothetical protein
MHKTIAFDADTWLALVRLGRARGRSLQEMADEAFGDLLKKHNQTVPLGTSLKASVRRTPHR